MTTTRKKKKETLEPSGEAANAWAGYNRVLDIIQEGLKEGIDTAIEDARDPHGVWSTAKDAYDYADKMSEKMKKSQNK
jgi:hypothetical protein